VPTYLFETMTGAQAAGYVAASDTIVFTNPAASASNTTVTYGSGTITITEGPTGVSLTFGTGMLGESDFIFPNSSHLTIPTIMPPPTPPSPLPPPPPPTSTLPIAPSTVSGATGAISGNMDAVHLGGLLGSSIDISTATRLFLNGGSTQLTLGGTGFVYDANAQLVAGTVTSISYAVGGGDTLLATLQTPGTSAVPFGGWVLTDATQAAFTTILAGNDRIAGGIGADLLHAYGGNDVLWGGGGADTLFGGDGDDFIYALYPAGVSGAGRAGASLLRGEAGNDVIQGGDAFDDINGNQGNDSIDGGSGGDDWLVGGQGNDLIIAHTGGNILYGNLGDDTLQGGSGAEILRGGQGNDSISGGGGADWLSGDKGNDTIAGGAGADTFHTFSGAGIDRVTDFNPAEGDRVQVDVGAAWTVSQVGSDTVIDMGGGDQMVLVGVQMSTLTGAWIFAA
jgi:Ca2+-binding RTX toxin-like protein